MYKNDLSEKLSKWDRKHRGYLIEIYQENQRNPKFLNTIIDIYINQNRDDLEHSTTWIIKHFLDKGGVLNKIQIDTILSNIGNLNFWESQLHILQITPKVDLTVKNAKLMESNVRAMMKSDKKFVRAAAYEAYFEIVKLIPELKNEFIALCEHALETESASIKSKVKRIITGAYDRYK